METRRHLRHTSWRRRLAHQIALRTIGWFCPEGCNDLYDCPAQAAPVSGACHLPAITSCQGQLSKLLDNLQLAQYRPSCNWQGKFSVKPSFMLGLWSPTCESEVFIHFLGWRGVVERVIGPSAIKRLINHLIHYRI